MSYSLDAQSNVTITGNMTLPELSYGAHSIIVYANDTAGNIGASETIYFSIEPFSPTLVAVAIVTAVVAAVVIGLLVVYRKRKIAKERIRGY